MWSVEYCTGLFLCGLEVCAHLVVGGVCVAEVRGGGLRCWELCVFVIKSLHRLWVFSVVVRLNSDWVCGVIKILFCAIYKQVFTYIKKLHSMDIV